MGGGGRGGGAEAAAAAAAAVRRAWAAGARLVVVHAVAEEDDDDAAAKAGGEGCAELARWAWGVRAALAAAPEVAGGATLLCVVLAPTAGAPWAAAAPPALAGGADLGCAFPGFEGVPRPAQSFERLGAEGEAGPVGEELAGACMLLSQWGPGLVREDPPAGAGGRGALGDTLAAHFLRGLAFTLGCAPKYGA